MSLYCYISRAINSLLFLCDLLIIMPCFLNQPTTCLNTPLAMAKDAGKTNVDSYGSHCHALVLEDEDYGRKPTKISSWR